MQDLVTIFVLVAGTVLATLAATVGMAGTVQMTSRRTHGYLHLIFYAMVLMLALASIVSARDLSQAFLSLEKVAEPVRHPLVKWSQPLISLLLLTVAGERIISYWLRRDKAVAAPPVLLAGFIVFWLCTVAAPAFLGANPFVSHDYAYPLVIGVAAVLVSSIERDMALKAARNALVLFMLAGLLLIAVKPSMVLDTTYTQGLLPGVPRLAGLAAHAVSLGILAQLGLLCLLGAPYRQPWLNRMAWAVGLSSLFLAQSKSAWLSFALCLLVIGAVRHGPALWRRIGDASRPEFGVLSVLGFMLVVLSAALVLMFGDLNTRIDAFFSSAEGAQLASMTGRDKIWAVAYEEWQRNPVFGYGPLIWDTSFRISVGMPNATHAHNQFMDTLSRSGTVGAVALVFYALVLLVLSVRHARASRGLTLGLFLVLALRSVSEVPLSLFGYGPEFVTHVLLLIALAASARERSAPRLQPQAAAQPPRAAPRPARAAQGHLVVARFKS